MLTARQLQPLGLQKRLLVLADLLQRIICRSKFPAPVLQKKTPGGEGATSRPYPQSVQASDASTMQEQTSSMTTYKQDYMQKQAAGHTSFSAMRRSKSDFLFSHLGMAVTLRLATSGCFSRPWYSTARCCRSASMK